jgi:hypothetical protein
MKAAFCRMGQHSVEQLFPIPSPPQSLSSCARNKVAFASYARGIPRSKGLEPRR